MKYVSYWLREINDFDWFDFDIWISSWSRRSSHGGSARTHSKLTKTSGQGRPSIIFSPLGLCEPSESNKTANFLNYHVQSVHCTICLTGAPRSTVFNINVLFIRRHSLNFYFETVFSSKVCAHTVKRVDEVVRHPHLVTQDQNTQVSNKVSDISEENFTKNIELLRHFSQVSPSSTELESLKSMQHAGREPTP